MIVHKCDRCHREMKVWAVFEGDSRGDFAEYEWHKFRDTIDYLNRTAKRKVELCESCVRETLSLSHLE